MFSYKQISFIIEFPFKIAYRLRFPTYLLIDIKFLKQTVMETQTTCSGDKIWKFNGHHLKNLLFRIHIPSLKNNFQEILEGIGNILNYFYIASMKSTSNVLIRLYSPFYILICCLKLLRILKKCMGKE